jgi:hypothetical protein
MVTNDRTRTANGAPRKAPRTVQEFRRRLRELHAECGAPASADIRRAIRDVTTVPGLAASTLSEFFSDTRPTVLPRQDFVRGFVAGCLLHSGAASEDVTEAVEQWDDWWRAVLTSTGQPPIRIGKPSTDTPSDSLPPWWRRHSTLIAAVGCGVLGFAMGTLMMGWDRWTSTSDPSLAYDTCAENLQISRVVGQIALIADRGPHSKPIQDRRIELRAQKHPQHGWILWAHLAETPSNVDRLWLDWSYHENPTTMTEFRQCGAQPISDGADTPAIQARDVQGRPRWFRACGQVYPAEQRAPNASGTFCTSWTRPDV